MGIYGYIVQVTDREINIKDQILTIREDVETVYEKTVTPFGNSGKVNVAKKYIGKSVYVIVL
jgi:putative transposon-encoded protein